MQYEKVLDFNEGLAPVTKNGKSGFIDTTGAIVIPLQYDYTWHFSKSLLAVDIEDMMGLINKFGQVVIPLEYDNIGMFEASLAPAKKDGLWGFIDTENKNVIPFKYDKVEPFINNIALVTKNAQVGLVDKLGKEIVPVQFNDLKFLDLTYINFLDEDIEGSTTFKLEDEQGNTLAIVDNKTNFSEDSLWYFEGDITSVRQDAQLGYLDNDIAIIPRNQDAIKPFNKGIILVKKDGSIFYIKAEVS